MSIYRRIFFSPTGVTSLLSCCYGNRNGRPSSPDILPTNLPMNGVGDVGGNCESDADDKCETGAELQTVGSDVKGILDIAISLDSASKRLTVQVLQGKDILPAASPSESPIKSSTDSPVMSAFNQSRFTRVQVHFVLLPDKRQRRKTEMVPADVQKFDFTSEFLDISLSNLPNLSIRFRVYAAAAKQRARLLSQAIFPLGSLQHPELDNPVQLLLQSCNDEDWSSDTGYSDTCSVSSHIGSLCSLGVAAQAELLLGICYNAVTGQLLLHVVKGSCFKLQSAVKAPDTFVKLRIIASNGQQLFKCKTRTVQANFNPVWQENFAFPVNKFQLPDISVSVRVCAKRNLKRRSAIGGFCLGNSSKDNELEHWQEALQAKGELVCRWHRLQSLGKR